MKAIIEKVKSFGFQVYARAGDDISYFYFVDGNKIGSIHEGKNGYDLCTVHRPSLQIGCNFHVKTFFDVSELTVSILESAFQIAPEWVRTCDRERVVKFGNWEKFVDSSIFNKGFVLR